MMWKHFNYICSLVRKQAEMLNCQRKGHVKNGDACTLGKKSVLCRQTRTSKHTHTPAQIDGRSCRVSFYLYTLCVLWRWLIEQRGLIRYSDQEKGQVSGVVKRFSLPIVLFSFHFPHPIAAFSVSIHVQRITFYYHASKESLISYRLLRSKYHYYH